MLFRSPQFQPGYKAVQQRRAALDEAKRHNHNAAKKKLAVGLARQFAVDWWRIRTGKTTPEKLGLQMSWPSASVLRAKAPAKPADSAKPSA